MHQFFRFASVYALLVLLPQTLLAEDNYDRRWQATVFGGVVSLDNDRPGVDDTAVYGLGIGRFLTTNFSIDLEYDRIDSSTNNLGLGGPRADLEMNSLGFVGRYHVSNPNSKVRPYILAGFGGTDHSGLFSSSTDLYITAGMGLRLEFSDHFFGRLQVAYRLDGDDVIVPEQKSSFDDILLTAGLTYAFGERRRPAKPAAPVRPVPVAAVTPPPPAPPAQPIDGDDDNDGVKNSKDRCPDTRPGAVVGLDGCEVTERIELPGVNFAFDSARLTPESESILDDAAEILQKHDALIVIVAGHTDYTGTDAYNQVLSERRANSVRDYLIARGIDGGRMTARGYGESQPVASNETREGRARNRRVELVINGH